MDKQIYSLSSKEINLLLIPPAVAMQVVSASLMAVAHSSFTPSVKYSERVASSICPSEYYSAEYSKF